VAGGIAYLFRDSIAAVAKQLGVTAAAFVDWLNGAGRFLAADVKLPHWELGLLWTGIVLLTAILLFIYLIYRFPNTPQYRYHGDLLYGLKWRWSISQSNKVVNPRIYCPECDHPFHEADFKFAKATASGAEFETTCENCPYMATTLASPLLYGKVQRDVERKILSGAWKQSKVR
jgi:hypothetical protein